MGNKALRSFLIPIATLIGFIAVWQISCIVFEMDPWILPDPRTIALRMAEDSALLWKHFLSTLKLALMGVGLGLAVGIIVAIVLHSVSFLRTALSPLLVLSQNVPIIALGPLLMIWFDFGLMPKLILLIIVCFFPIALSMLIGLGQAEPQLREYLGMIGATRWERMKRLEFPASLPYLFSGLKITATYAVSSAVVAEWLGASKGIGYYLVLKFKGYDTSAVFGAIVCIVTLSLLLYGAAALLERLVIRWRPRTSDDWAGESS
ncbi:ABC transporter permease [Cohnella luojiensis]|uniref:ABC transporter permease n=1 Tax=Cohnella luojiensis TaxID=652876 RepID=A0A4Y8LZV4_9BACL|nr:ABC transporter permease [Cohnella luojiensis]TFE24969.1 ABC transporter permease [Cohnella luojiensis]